LHVKNVEQFDWGKVDALVEKHLGTMGTLWWRLVAPFRDAATTASLHDGRTTSRSSRNCRLSMADIELLVRKGYLVEIPPGDVRGECKSFTVLEVAKMRRRWILHPSFFNDCSLEDEAICCEKKGLFPTPSEIVNRARDYRHACCFDFAWFFGQFGMNSEAAKFFCLWKEGRAYAPTTVPTGARQPPLAAQILCKALLAEVACRTCTSFGADAFIDNIRLLADDAENLTTIAKSFVDLCSEVRITLNDGGKIEICQKYTFLGIVFDHALRQVTIAEKTRSKLQQPVDWESMTWQHVQSLFGVLVFAASVLALNRSQYYYIYKYMRKRCASGTQLWEAAKVWPSSIPLWNMWLQTLANAPPREILHTPGSLTIYTDASKTGYGAILYSPTGDHTISGSWKEGECDEHINLLELKAVRIAIQNLPFPELSTITIFVDNTSTEGQLKKTRTSSYAHNRELQKIEEVLSLRKVKIVESKYVKSALNPADPLSRGDLSAGPRPAENLQLDKPISSL
jgi:hypothetical protein